MWLSVLPYNRVAIEFHTLAFAASRCCNLAAAVLHDLRALLGNLLARMLLYLLWWSWGGGSVSLVLVLLALLWLQPCGSP